MLSHVCIFHTHYAATLSPDHKLSFFVEKNPSPNHMKSMSEHDPFSQSSQFERAVRGLLTPLIRALIAQNVTATSLYRIIKRTYVDVAAEMLGPQATDSRISVMTGVHRRDVSAFRSSAQDQTAIQDRKVSILSTVVGRWLSQADYLDEGGQPLPLPRTSDDGPSFDELVQSVSRDVRPRTMLDELERQGIVKRVDGTIVLMVEGLVGSADMQQRLHFFSHNLGDHMNAAVDNLLSEVPPHLERAVFYNNLDLEAVETIEAEARKIGETALRDINSQAAELQSPNATDLDATHRFRFGVFFYREDEGPKTKGHETDEDR